ncbi:MAG: hypothetical protein A2X86_11895 [Bdellovibrionales bacterium GWA2_49_15]|nr:MAG: hypothetical protein A2X86_11895 [Bdellovibrionales bacterium GWA2_49_15]HAZ12546.1 hypothetical protein [Bdellovibrionales bacterium]
MITILPTIFMTFRESIIDGMSNILNVKVLKHTAHENIVCGNGICHRDTIFDFQSLDSGINHITVGFFGFSTQGCLLSKGVGEVCDEKRQDILEPNYFKFSTATAIDPAEKFVIRSFNLVDTPSIGSKEPLLFVGSHSSLEIIKSVFELFSVHSFLFQGLLFLLLPAFLVVSRVVDKPSEISFIYFTGISGFLAQIIFSHNFSYLVIKTGMSFAAFLAVYRLVSLFFLIHFLTKTRRIGTLATSLMGFTLVCYLTRETYPIFNTSSYRCILAFLFLVSVYKMIVERRIGLAVLNIVYFHDLLLFFGFGDYTAQKSLLPLAIFPAFAFDSRKYIENFLISNIYLVKKKMVEIEFEQIREILKNEIVNLDRIIPKFIHGITQSRIAQRITTCTIENSNPVLRIGDDGKFKSIDDGILPPVFARVFQTAEAYWWTSNDGFSKLRMREKIPKAGVVYDFSDQDLSCVLPITANSEVLGAISISKFNLLCRNSPFERQTINNLIASSLDLLNGILASVEKDKSKKISMMSIEVRKSLIAACSRSGNITQAYLNSLESMCNALNLKAVILEVCKERRTTPFYFTNNFIQSQRDPWIKTPFAMREENKIGPLPVAYNERKIVIIKNAHTYNNIISKMSSELLKESDSRQVAIIPLKVSGLDTLVCLLDISSQQLGVMEKEFLDIFQSTVLHYDEHFHVKNDLLNNQNMLSNFIPERVREKLLENSEYSEQDTGYLLMIDCRGSSKIANYYKNDKMKWLNESKKIIAYLQEEAEKYGLIYQEDRWDAFFLTLSADKANLTDVKKIEKFLAKSINFFNEFYSSSFSEIDECQDFKSPKIRACLNYGDISRGLSAGELRNWIITGREMANIHKFESIVKNLQKNEPAKFDDAFMFVDQSVLTIFDTALWQDIDCIIPSNGRKIFKLKITWGMKFNSENEVA